MRKVAYSIFLLVVVLLGTTQAWANVFGQVHGVVHDPLHRPIGGANVTLRAGNSDLKFAAVSDRDGGFAIANVPLGDYVVTVSDEGFADFQQTVTVNSDSTVTLHLQMAIATVKQTVTVEGMQDSANVDSVTPETVIDRTTIAQTPGADRTNSLAMITDYVPGAYMTHDMLHMRGGHELSWLIDGVFIPNTNIASNIGPQIDPKDIDTLEVERGSYSADLGDRTYGDVQRGAAHRLRAQSRWRTGGDGGKLFADQRSGQFWRPHGEVCVVYQPQRQPQRLWVAAGDRAAGARCGERVWRVCVGGLQPRSGGPASRGGPVAARTTTRFRTILIRATGRTQLYDSSGLRDGEHETDSYAALTWLHTFSADDGGAGVAVLPFQPVGLSIERE